ncbi:hypothetical protein RUM44_000261 [Polyplax serrata]|uniref:Uncharacterized protein n=1 Tax=Polyplax serrata TaxID=468196 RepID=A0ABR1B6C5_POLSC
MLVGPRDGVPAVLERSPVTSKTWKVSRFKRKSMRTLRDDQVRREVSLTGKQRHEIRHRKGVEKENGVTGEGHTTLGYQVPQAPKKVVKGNHQKVIFIEPNYSICNVKGKSKGRWGHSRSESYPTHLRVHTIEKEQLVGWLAGWLTDDKQTLDCLSVLSGEMSVIGK